MKIEKLLRSLTETEETYNRRKFLTATGTGLLMSTILGSFENISAQNKSKSDRSSAPDKAIHPNDLKMPVELKSLDHETELQKSPIPAPAPPDKRIGYAIVGLGTLALNQVMPAFGSCKYSRPVALVSGVPEKAKIIARQYGISETSIYNYDNFDAILDNKDIDVVYIILPNNMHAEYTIRAAKAGKHVLCEKPMAISSTEAQTMVDACNKANRKLMIGYRIQHEPNNTQIKEWVRNKTYGEVKLIDSFNGQNLGDPTQWRLKKKMGGGSLGDVGIYCLNSIRFLLGEEPDYVLASTYNTPGDPRFTEVEESVMFQLGFPSGVIANCGTSFNVHESRSYRCYTNKGAWFGMDPAFSYKGLQMELSQAQDKIEMRSHPFIGEQNQFALEMDHFSKCIMEDKPPYTTGDEGVQDMRIIEAIFESARTGKKVTLAKVDRKDAFRGTEPGK